MFIEIKSIKFIYVESTVNKAHSFQFLMLSNTMGKTIWRLWQKISKGKSAMPECSFEF